MSFYSVEAQREVEAAVAAIEQETAAEIVVAVRKQARDHTAIDLAFASVAAFATLLVLLFHPRPFSVAAMPFDVLVSFAAAFFVCRRVPALRRRFIRDSGVLTAARAAFVELSVSRTTGRTGVLVFVAGLERDVAIVCDVGVPVSLDATALRAAVQKDDVAAFVTALRAFTPALRDALPRSANDLNELPNAVA